MVVVFCHLKGKQNFNMKIQCPISSLKYVCVYLRFSRDFIGMAFLGDLVYEEVLGRETLDLRDFCFVCVLVIFWKLLPGDW